MISEFVDITCLRQLLKSDFHINVPRMAKWLIVMTMTQWVCDTCWKFMTNQELHAVTLMNVIWQSERHTCRFCNIFFINFSKPLDFRDIKEYIFHSTNSILTRDPQRRLIRQWRTIGWDLIHKSNNPFCQEHAALWYLVLCDDMGVIF